MFTFDLSLSFKGNGALLVLVLSRTDDTIIARGGGYSL